MHSMRALLDAHLERYRAYMERALAARADGQDTWEDLQQTAEAALKGAQAIAAKYFPGELLCPDA